MRRATFSSVRRLHAAEEQLIRREKKKNAGLFRKEAFIAPGGKIKSSGRREVAEARDRPTITPYRTHSPGKDCSEGVNYGLAESDGGSRGLEVFVEPQNRRRRLSFIRRARTAEIRDRFSRRANETAGILRYNL